MQICCPKCQFTREISDEKVPPTATTATCPKCAHRFCFRQINEPKSSVSEPISQDDTPKPQKQAASSIITPSQQSSPPQQRSGDIWDDIASLDDTTRAAQPPKVEPQQSDAYTQKQPPPVSESPPNGEGKDMAASGQVSSAENSEDEAKPPHKTPDMQTMFDEGASGTLPNLHDLLNRPEPQDIPWEWLDRYGIFAALFETIKRVLFMPARFFATMRPSLTITSPITFYLLLSLFEELAARGWMMLALRYLELPEPVKNLFTRVAQDVASPASILSAVLVMLLKLTLLTALYHMLLSLAGGNKNGITVTLRVIAYSSSAALLMLVPFVGLLAAVLYGMVLTLIGIKYGHGISWPKAIFVSLPVYLLALICTLLLVPLFLA